MSFLTLTNLNKKYGALQAVDNLSFNMEQGVLLGLLGPNGAGKSTTISMISTLLTPDSGTILFKGEDIVKNPKAIQRVMGVVPQEIALYPTLTGHENLMFWGSLYGLKGKLLKDRIAEVSEIIGITDRLKDRVDKYSGGMKRRINIGAALLHQPEFLIMDEPTVGIDPQSRNHILETVKKLNEQGMTIIYTSHYMEEVEYLCNEIYIMDEGKTIASGTKASLLESFDGMVMTQLVFERINPELMAQLATVDGVKDVKRTEDKVMIASTHEDLLKSLLSLEAVRECSLRSVDVLKPNLEQVFLQLTGKALRD